MFCPLALLHLLGLPSAEHFTKLGSKFSQCGRLLYSPPPFRTLGGVISSSSCVYETCRALLQGDRSIGFKGKLPFLSCAAFGASCSITSHALGFLESFHHCHMYTLSSPMPFGVTLRQTLQKHIYSDTHTDPVPSSASSSFGATAAGSASASTEFRKCPKMAIILCKKATESFQMLIHGQLGKASPSHTTNYPSIIA